MTGGGNLVRYERYRKSPRATKSAHARYYYTRSLVLDSPVKRRARSTSSPNRTARCHSAPKIMDSHSRSASPREAQRPQIRPPSPPSSPSPTGFDNRAYQPDDADDNHNQSFTSNGTNGTPLHQNGHKQNGDTKLEAVNLELINLTPKNSSKKDSSVDINASNPYDEYFVPVNEHRKFMRGEKLYVTSDKRGEKSSCKRPLCWTLLVLVVAAIVAIIVLAATGILFSGQPSALNPYNSTVSSARAFGSVISDHEHTPNDQNNHDQNGHDHSVHDHSSHDHSVRGHSDHDGSAQDTASDSQHGPETEPQNDDADKMVEDDSDMSMYVPRTLEGSLSVDNEEYTPALEDPESNEYRDFVNTFAHGLKRALFNRTVIDSGDNDIAIEIIKLREGSVEVTYRVHWKPKNNNVEPANVLLTTRTLINKLNNYLEKNNRMINIYHIAENNIKAKPVLDICQVDNNQCEYGCEFDETTLEFTCTCPHGQMIDMNNGKRCVSILENAQLDANDHENDDNVTIVHSVASTYKPTPDNEKPISETVHMSNATFDWKETNHNAQPTTTESETEVNFSHIYGFDHRHQPEAAAEPTAEPKPEPEPTTEPKAEPEPMAEPKAEPEPTAEPKAEPEPTTEPKAEPEPTAEPSVELEPTAEPRAEPEPKLEPEPNSEPEPKAEPEPTAHPKTEAESTTEPKAEPEPTVEPNAQPKPTAEPKAEPEPTAEPKAESELSGSVAEPEPTTEQSAEPEAEPKPSAEPASEPEPADLKSSDLENKHHLVTITTEPTSEPEPTVVPQFEYNMKTETISIPKPTSMPKPSQTGDIDFDFDLHPSLVTEPTIELIEAETTLSSKSATESSTIEQVSTLRPMHSEDSNFLQISDFINKDSNANNTEEIETTTEQISIPDIKEPSYYDPATDFITFFGKHSNIKKIMAEDDQNVEFTESSKNNESTDFDDWLEDITTQKENQDISNIEEHERSKMFDISIEKENTTLKSEINANDNVNQTISSLLVNDNDKPEEIFTNAPAEYNEDTTIINSATEEYVKKNNAEQISTSTTEIIMVDNNENSEKLLTNTSSTTTEEPNSEVEYSILEHHSSNNEEKQLIDALNTKANVTHNETEKTTENSKQEEVMDITFDVINNNLFNRSSKSIENRTHNNQANESLLNLNNEETFADSDWLSEPVTELNYEDEMKNQNKMTTEAMITKVDEILNDARLKDDFEPDYLMTHSHHKTIEQELPSYGMGLDYVDDDSRVKRVNTDAPSKKGLNEEFNEKKSVTKMHVPVEATTVSDYIYKSAEKIVPTVNEKTKTEESVPAPVWEENERDLIVKDLLNSTNIPITTTARVDDIVVPSEMTLTTTIAPASQTPLTPTTLMTTSSSVITDSSGIGEFNNLNVTIYEIPNHNNSMGDKDSQIPDFEDHETEMNPFLPEVENNKILVKKLQEGHDIEPNNLTETQNENNDEHNNVSEITTRHTDTDKTNVETLTLQPSNASTTEDFTSFQIKSEENNTKYYKGDSSEEAKKILPIPTFLLDTDDLDVIREPTTERKSTISDNNLEREVVTGSPSQVRDDNLRVVPIEEKRLGALKTYSSESMQELNDISDSPKKSDRRTLEETKFHSVLNNEA